MSVPAGVLLGCLLKGAWRTLRRMTHEAPLDDVSLESQSFQSAEEPCQEFLQEGLENLMVTSRAGLDPCFPKSSRLTTQLWLVTPPKATSRICDQSQEPREWLG